MWKTFKEKLSKIFSWRKSDSTPLIIIKKDERIQKLQDEIDQLNEALSAAETANIDLQERLTSQMHLTASQEKTYITTLSKLCVTGTGTTEEVMLKELKELIIRNERLEADLRLRGKIQEKKEGIAEDALHKMKVDYALEHADLTFQINKLLNEKQFLEGQVSYYRDIAEKKKG